MKRSSLKKEEIYRAHQGDERLRRDQQLLHEQLLKQNWDLLEAHERSLSEMEELKRFQGSTFDTIARRKLVEDRDTILELTGEIQELQNEINCMNDLRDFQDAESVRGGHSHVASQPVSFPPHPVLGGMLSRTLGMPSRKNGPPSIWDTHGKSGNVFCKSNSVFFSTLSARVEYMPNFEVLDAKIASALNRIIHNTQFKRKVSKSQKRTVSFVEDRSLT